MRIRWLPDAFHDLEEIYAYLLEHHPYFAHSTVVEIYDAIRSLGRTPFRGRPGAEPQTRELVLTPLPYIVFYQIKDETVEILYIRHGGQDR